MGEYRLVQEIVYPFKRQSVEMQISSEFGSFYRIGSYCGNFERGDFVPLDQFMELPKIKRLKVSIEQVRNALKSSSFCTYHPSEDSACIIESEDDSFDEEEEL